MPSFYTPVTSLPVGGQTKCSVDEVQGCVGGFHNVTARAQVLFPPLTNSEYEEMCRYTLKMYFCLVLFLLSLSLSALSLHLSLSCPLSPSLFFPSLPFSRPHSIFHPGCYRRRSPRGRRSPCWGLDIWSSHLGRSSWSGGRRVRLGFESASWYVSPCLCDWAYKISCATYRKEWWLYRVKPS